jgi:hypothetical protein
MAARDLVAIDRDRVERDPFRSGVVRSAVPVSAGRVLTNEQAGAAGISLRRRKHKDVRGLAAAGRSPAQARPRCICAWRLGCWSRAGRSSFLVPEIALTPAVASAFREAFGDQVAVQHSGLSDGERYDQWHRIRRGEVSIVVGTRSAVFAPLTHLGLIIVDEEHDTSFKQEETPRYHGRDVAVMRGKQEAAWWCLGPPRRRWKADRMRRPAGMSAF